MPGGRLKAVYVVPSFANPTGHVMSMESRRRLLEAAVRQGVCVIEDDPYGELWFDRPPPDSLCALNQYWKIGATVTYATSFSKIVMPAFRLGALFAPAAIRRGALLVKQATDVHSSTIDQRFLDELLRSGRLPSHEDSLRAAYSNKAKAMARALTTMTPDLLSFTKPAGGMFVWAHLKGAAQAQSSDSIDWFAFGRSHRVLAVPGAAFSPSDARSAHVRLCFANPPLEDIHEGIRRLAAGLTAELARASSSAHCGPPASALRERV
jgi:DNA-binding transcriptional MocR family regulator